jgi:hypothetical protein
MASFKKTPTPVCGKCQQPMSWISERVVDSRPIQIFHCEDCDRYEAVSPGTNGVNVNVAPNVESGRVPVTEFGRAHNGGLAFFAPRVTGRD